jgi:hypothetical protein
VEASSTGADSAREVVADEVATIEVACGRLERNLHVPETNPAESTGDFYVVAPLVE